MLGGAWLLITFALLLAAVILRQVPLLLVALLFFLASGVARLWAHYALERIEYSRSLSARRAFFGETITLELRIANLKVLPLPWVRVEDEVPEELTFLKGKTSPSYKPGRAILLNLLSLGWYHRLIRRYPVQCLRRGYFSFGPATIRSGDLFGFFQKQMTDEKQDYLLVYPRVVSLEELGIPSRDPFGDLRVRRHLFQDPVRVVSTRDYVHGDPMRRIHWKATARLRRLQSRVFEPTTTVDLALFLDVRTVPFWGLSEQLLETAVIAAASIASYANDQGYRVGLYVNEPYRRTDRLIKLPPSDHPDQLQRVLEALAHVQGWPLINIERLLSREGQSLPWGATMVVVTALPGEPLLASLNRFRRAGRRVALILVGGQPSRFNLDGLPMYNVSDQVYWRELSSLRLSQPR
jgi:uncharacterized protein (DUF58 family)